MIRRGVFVITACAMLAGCNLEITVPEGGSVVSSTGIYGCAPGERCTIEIDHPYFDETFTAVPAPGYQFSNWAEGQGSFCKSSTEALCDEVTTTLFLALDHLASFLSADITYYLAPRFEASGDTGEVPSPWVIRSNHAAVNYPVTGADEVAINDSINSDTNPLGIFEQNGLRFVGWAESQFSFSYGFRQDPSTNYCELTSGELEVEYVTTLPQHVDLQALTPEYLDSWTAYQDAVVEHEAGHQVINREYYQELYQTLTGFEGANCDTLADELGAIVDDLALRLNQAQNDYHARVGTFISISDYF